MADQRSWRRGARYPIITHAPSPQPPDHRLHSTTTNTARAALNKTTPPRQTRAFLRCAQCGADPEAYVGSTDRKNKVRFCSSLRASPAAPAGHLCPRGCGTTRTRRATHCNTCRRNRATRDLVEGDIFQDHRQSPPTRKRRPPDSDPLGGPVGREPSTRTASA